MASTDLTELAEALEALGLFVRRPLLPADLATARVDFDLRAVLPGARGAWVLGDGGGTFFAGFQAAGRESADGAPDPLDRYTKRVLGETFARVLGPQGSTYALRFPFGGGRTPLPIAALGTAAGIAPAGPLGLQIHPRFGPWWAYRALAVLAVELPPAPPLARPCAGCPAPCVAACPGQAVTPQGLQVSRCVCHRLADPGCHTSCAARLACVVAPHARYPHEHLAFHMSASLATIRSA